MRWWLCQCHHTYPFINARRDVELSELFLDDDYYLLPLAFRMCRCKIIHHQYSDPYFTWHPRVIFLLVELHWLFVDLSVYRPMSVWFSYGTSLLNISSYTKPPIPSFRQLIQLQQAQCSGSGGGWATPNANSTINPPYAQAYITVDGLYKILLVNKYARMCAIMPDVSFSYEYMERGWLWQCSSAFHWNITYLETHNHCSSSALSTSYHLRICIRAFLLL